MRLIPCVLASAILSSMVMGQLPVLSGIRGENNLDYMGNSVCVADLNGDQVEDVLIGQPGFDGAAGGFCGRVICVSGATGEVLYEVEGSLADQGLGRRMVIIGDLNGDSIPEWASGNWRSQSLNPGPATSRHGYVTIHEGSTGIEIFNHVGAQDLDGDNWGDALGARLGAGGDVDGDGTPDYIMVAWSDSSMRGSCSLMDEMAYCDVISGATFTRIHLIGGFNGVVGNCQGPISATIFGDINADGRDEIVVGYSRGSNQLGHAVVYDGLTGNALFSNNAGPGTAGDFYGNRVVAAGDWNGDTIPDYAVAATNSGGPGYFDIRSGVNGSLLQVRAGTFINSRFANAGLIAAGDLNGNGFGDFLVSIPRNGPLEEGRIELIDGMTGAVIYAAMGERGGDRLGQGGALALMQDLDQDGLPEIVGGAWSSNGGPGAGGTPPTGNDNGYCAIYGSQARSHWLPQTLVDRTTGAVLTFEVQGAPNEFYWVLGSLTGNSGIPVAPGVSLPLTLDSWFLMTLNPPSPTFPFANANGILGISGRATAELIVPPIPFIATLRHWSAVGFYEASTGVIRSSEDSKFSIF